LFLPFGVVRSTKKESGVKSPHSKDSAYFSFQVRADVIQTEKAKGRTTESRKDTVGILRIRLIEQLCRIPESHLPPIEAFLTALRDPPAVLEHGVLPAHTSQASRLVPPAANAWPHAPVHRLSEHGTFLITAATREKAHFFRSQEDLTFLVEELLRQAKQHGLTLEAWAVFSNHYHFIAHVTTVVNPLATFIEQLHITTATELNRRHGTSGRQVWFQYWDTQLTFEKSYLARLNYVHQNAVKHGLVERANQYRWCSAAWFERAATVAQVKTIFKYDRIRIADDYAPVLPQL
jgi:putative transposase